MRYLISGGTGFIGVNFANRLLSDGHHVIILDNLSRNSGVANLSWITGKFRSRVKFVHADLRIVSEHFSELIEQVDVVFHLSAQVAVTSSISDPRLDFESNALATFNVLEAIRNSKRRPALIFASTNKVYGKMEDLEVVERDERYDRSVSWIEGVSEERPLDFHSPYGCSKGAADQYVSDYSRIFGLETVVFRQSCIYGPRQFGVEDQGWVAWFIIAAITGKPVSIFGNGKQVRDLLHVQDLYQCFQAAVERLDCVSGEVFNVGGGPDNTLSLLELVSLLRERLGVDLPVKYEIDRPGDQPVYVSDISKAERLLGWSPQISAKNGIMDLIDWVGSNKCLFESN